jgi:predicted amino acid-binding ACT domain protein
MSPLTPEKPSRKQIDGTSLPLLYRLHYDDLVPDEIARIDYYTVTVADKPGEAARLLTALSEAGVNLIAFSGFPQGARKAQIDLMPADSAAFKKAMKHAGYEIGAKKTGFIVQGEDHVGAIAGIARKLAEAGINITAFQAMCAGANRWAGLFWVKAEELRKAEKTLGVVKAAKAANA